jgi:hypothetical protein
MLFYSSRYLMSETFEILGTVYLIPQRLLLRDFTLTGTFHESPLCGAVSTGQLPFSTPLSFTTEILKPSIYGAPP